MSCLSRVDYFKKIGLKLRIFSVGCTLINWIVHLFMEF